MKKIISLSILAIALISCSESIKKDAKKTTVTKTSTQEKMTEKPIDKSLPTIGILIFEQR